MIVQDRQDQSANWASVETHLPIRVTPNNSVFWAYLAYSAYLYLYHWNLSLFSQTLEPSCLSHFVSIFNKDNITFVYFFLLALN